MKKKRLLLLLLFFGCLHGFAQTDTSACLIVVLGSSTAEGAGPSASDSAWVNRYRTALGQKNTRFAVINLAKGGYTTYHILPTGTRVPAGIDVSVDTARNLTKALSLKPDVLIVNMPSNDAANHFSAAQQLTNFSKIAEIAEKAGVKVWICTTQPRNFSDPVQVRIQREVADSIFAIYGDRAIDFWNGLADTSGHIRKEYDSGDGIHLNNAGHRILFERVQEKMFPPLPYYEIPANPDTFSAENVVARMIDGLGFRFYWATDGLRPEDLAFRPSPEARTSEETIDHILGLSRVILNAVEQKPNVQTAGDLLPAIVGQPLQQQGQCLYGKSPAVN